MNTPYYVFDIDKLKERFNKMRKLTEGKFNLCYSIKANPLLTKEMSEMADNLEVCSPGEMLICDKVKVPADHIIYSGVYKEKDAVSFALDCGVVRFTAESIGHVNLLEDAASESDKNIEVLLRLNAGSQFGMSKEDFETVIKDRDKYPHLNIVGIHYFVGTQRKKLKDHEEELDMLKDFAAKIKDEYGFELKCLEYGPGLYVPLFDGEDYSDTLLPYKEILPKLFEMADAFELTVEMGRFYVTNCGEYHTSVVDIKTNEGVNYAITDGGINHVNYYGQLMGMKKPVMEHIKKDVLGQKSGLKQRNDDETEKTYCLCGALCTIGDILLRKAQFNGLDIGDELVFYNIGAYSITESMYLFLSRTMPEVYFRKNGETILTRDKIETAFINVPD